MAFPKKGLRKITIDEIEYGYKVTGNDGYIDFAIGLLNENGEILTGIFSYNESIVTDSKEKLKSQSAYQRTKITPNTIQQVIEYGLKNGWRPQKNKGIFRLGTMDDKVELNLNEN